MFSLTTFNKKAFQG